MGELIANIRAALQEKIDDQRLDGRGDQASRRWPSSPLRSAHRPPGQIYRLFDAQGRAAATCSATRSASERFRLEAAAVALPQAGRPHAVGHAAADQQRLLRPDPRTRSPSRPRSCSRPISIPTPIRPSNYGSIGATIGHEIGHGFDDQGRKFDAQGQAARLVDAGDAPSSTRRAPTTGQAV